ncbi:hypothetical protein [Legionella bononiensis]|uniref:Uncharacterized protein n=1 Tax=Legionella bononiensis TaxID=2793102 RepID=A0ABS1WD56_9GAMM|nr:hypothetical protein [Legionella bononiensis]MBL7479152.1 hypothetical protein [Legionella bononiensis]MBL7527285.1 hypothetical protein [Legionella bononiensis]MBL7562254.1 hypothetical protein [Legionella bononiensis]
MNKELKKLLLKIAALPKSDQKWILNQLTANQQKQFELLEGNKLLAKARRFRTLAYEDSVTVNPDLKLPALCHDLKHQDSLYIAIILDQGQFPWREQFIQSLNNGNEIQQIMNDQVKTLKPDTKSSVFRQWQNQLNFDDQLVMNYG